MDTGVLVALCDPQDSLHKAARAHLNTLGKSPFAVCDAVVAEACFHLSTSQQRRRLKRVLEELNVRLLPEEDAQALWVAVFDWLEKYSEHAPDWADGYLAVLCGRNRNAKVWTYDAEFRTVWRRPNGTPIPLAVPWGRS